MRAAAASSAVPGASVRGQHIPHVRAAAASSALPSASAGGPTRSAGALVVAIASSTAQMVTSSTVGLAPACWKAKPTTSGPTQVSDIVVKVPAACTRLRSLSGVAATRWPETSELVRGVGNSAAATIRADQRGAVGHQQERYDRAHQPRLAD